MLSKRSAISREEIHGRRGRRAPEDRRNRRAGGRLKQRLKRGASQFTKHKKKESHSTVHTAEEVPKTGPGVLNEETGSVFTKAEDPRTARRAGPVTSGLRKSETTGHACLANPNAGRTIVNELAPGTLALFTASARFLPSTNRKASRNV